MCCFWQRAKDLWRLRRGGCPPPPPCPAFPAGDGSVNAAADAAPPAWTPLGAVQQRDADLVHLFHSLQAAAEGPAKAAALRQLNAEVRGGAVD